MEEESKQATLPRALRLPMACAEESLQLSSIYHSSLSSPHTFIHLLAWYSISQLPYANFPSTNPSCADLSSYIR